MRKNFAVHFLLALVFILLPLTPVKAGGPGSTVMPKNTLFLVRFWGDSKHFFAEQARQIVNEVFAPVQKNVLTWSGEMDRLDFQKKAPPIAEILPAWRPIYITAGASLSDQDPQKVVMSFYFNPSKVFFDDFVSKLGTKYLEKRTISSGKVYYKFKDRNFYFHFDGITLAAFDDETAMTNFMTGKIAAGNVTDLENYKKVINIDGNTGPFLGGFFNFDLIREYLGSYIKTLPVGDGDIQTARKTTMMLLQSNPLFAGLHAGGFSVEQKDNSLDFWMNFVKDQSPASTGSLEPTIYKRISPTRLRLFYETVDLTSKLEDIQHNLSPAFATQFAEIKQQLKTETNLDFDKDLVPLFKKRTAFLLRNSKDGIPGASLIFELDKPEDAASIEATIEKLQSGLTKSAVVENRFLVISGEDPTQVLLSKDSEVFSSMAFPDESSPVMNGSLKQLLFIKPEANILSISEQEKLPIALQNFSLMSYENSLRFRVGTRQLGDKNTCPSSISMFTNGAGNHDQTFDDVKTDDWFSGHVHAMAARGTVQGFKKAGSTVFKPLAHVTRAEFAKMMTTDLMSNYSEATGNQTYFKDVQNCDWFTPSIHKLLIFGFLDGYKDNTFRPGAPITRGEALQILAKQDYSLRQFNDKETELPFKDVKPQDWFYNAVKNAFLLKIIDGGSFFHPHEYLTRAEAAKLIGNLYDLNKAQQDKAAAEAAAAAKALETASGAAH